jgi:acyl-CoA-binding protein
MPPIVQLYALFKQGNQSPKFDDAPKPGAIDFKVRFLIFDDQSTKHSQDSSGR